MPPFGFLEPPHARSGRAGEGAGLMPEQFGLDQRLGQRRAVHDDQRLVPAGRQAVEALGDQFLAGPALADHQHRAAIGAARLARSTASRKAPDWPMNWLPRSMPNTIVQFPKTWQYFPTPWQTKGVILADNLRFPELARSLLCLR